MIKDELVVELTEELIRERHISAFENENDFKLKFYAAIQELNENVVGVEMDYETDYVARNLLKEYVFYDYYNMLPEFKERYASDFIKLQFKYHSSIIQ